MCNGYILTDNNLTVIVDSKPYTVKATHPKFSNIMSELANGNYEKIIYLISNERVVQHYISGIAGDLVYDTVSNKISYKGRIVTGVVVDKIVDFSQRDLPIYPIINFLENLLSNPSKTAIDELYLFLEYGNLPITYDGCFIAYKRVNNDYTSVYDKKTKNDIGTVVEMPRNEVDDIRDNVCSYGLHFCSYDYLKSFSGERIVLVKVNPMDVVSIPSDYNNTKGRACKYTVVGELTSETPLTETYYQYDFDDIDELEDDEEEFEDDLDIYEKDYDYPDVRYYHDGYSDGRKKLPIMIPATPCRENKNLYMAGYKDGKGHKTKQY